MDKVQPFLRIGANVVIVWIMCIGLVHFNRDPHMPHILAFILSVMSFIYVVPGIIDEVRGDVQLIGRMKQ